MKEDAKQVTAWLDWLVFQKLHVAIRRTPSGRIEKVVDMGSEKPEEE
jgi:hypothetical protein